MHVKFCAPGDRFPQIHFMWHHHYGGGGLCWSGFYIALAHGARWHKLRWHRKSACSPPHRKEPMLNP